MAKRKITATTAQKQVQEDDFTIDINEAQQSATDFWGKYGRMISLVGGGLAVIFGGYYAYKNLYLAPKQKEAVAAMSQAQFLFERDSFQKALDPQVDGTPGFLGIIDDFGGTNAANLAKYYAGVCYMQTGQDDKAVEFLGDYSPDGEVMGIMKNGAMADAYGNKGDFSSAIDHYKKAVSAGKNDVLTPIYMKRLGQLYEHQKQPDDAKKMYDAVKTEYPNSGAAADIDKFIFRATK
jgi:tetratricopeptide (TPR) repeat protein